MTPKMRTPIQGDTSFEEFAAIGYEYLGTVEFIAPGTEGPEQTFKLELRFVGGPTDHLWNYGKARDFYSDMIERMGGKVTAYGVTGVGPREDLLVEVQEEYVAGYWREDSNGRRWVKPHVRVR